MIPSEETHFTVTLLINLMKCCMEERKSKGATGRITRWKNTSWKPTDFLKELLDVHRISGAGLNKNSCNWFSKLLCFLHRNFPVKQKNSAKVEKDGKKCSCCKQLSFLLFITGQMLKKLRGVRKVTAIRTLVSFSSGKNVWNEELISQTSKTLMSVFLGLLLLRYRKSFIIVKIQPQITQCCKKLYNPCKISSVILSSVQWHLMFYIRKCIFRADKSSLNKHPVFQ